MIFTHDTAESLEAGVFLANSALEPDTLETMDQLESFFARFEYSGPPPKEADLIQVRNIRGALFQLFKATRDSAVPLVNAILAEQKAVPQVVRHGGLDWHIHATSDESPLATRILVESAMAMIDVIRSDEMRRFDRCQMHDCEGIVFDLSRNRSKKYCSLTCTNRAAVQAYRARKTKQSR